jgi:protein-tyrosine phosphatase
MIQQQTPYASHLVSLGCFLQLTTSSFPGTFGSAAAKATDLLIMQQMAHFVASDADGIYKSRRRLARSCSHLEKEFGEPAARLLFLENPRAAIEGSQISSISPTEAFAARALLWR